MDIITTKCESTIVVDDEDNIELYKHLDYSSYIKKVMYIELISSEHFLKLSEIPHIRDFFRILFDANMLLYLDGNLELHGKLKKNSFYAILKDSRLSIEKYFRELRPVLNELFDCDIESFRQDYNGDKPAKYKELFDELIFDFQKSKIYKNI